MTTRFRRLRRRVHRRGYILLFFGMLSLSFGLSLLNPSSRTSSSLQFIEAILPLPVWAALWLATAALSGWYAFHKRDRIAYSAFSGMVVIWGLMSVGGWAAGYVERGWVGGAIWLGFASVAMVISGWPDPQRDAS